MLLLSFTDTVSHLHDFTSISASWWCSVDGWISLFHVGSFIHW